MLLELPQSKDYASKEGPQVETWEGNVRGLRLVFLSGKIQKNALQAVVSVAMGSSVTLCNIFFHVAFYKINLFHMKRSWLWGCVLTFRCFFLFPKS